MTRTVNFKVKFFSYAQFRLPTPVPLYRRSSGSTIDPKKQNLCGLREFGILHGRVMGPAPVNSDPNTVCVPGPDDFKTLWTNSRPKGKDRGLTELKVGHFFSAQIEFPKQLVNSTKDRPKFRSGALRAVYAFHPRLGLYHQVKRRPCLLYAKDYRTLTVLVCTSRPPDKFSHRFFPFNYAMRLTGQPPAILHSADSPETAGGGYLFFTHAIVGRLVEKNYPLTDFRGPAGIVIRHFDRNTGDSWVPKTNYRLSLDQLKYIEDLNIKFWQGIRYDEHGREIEVIDEDEGAEATQKRVIRRTVGRNELADKKPSPPMTGRERMFALKKAMKVGRRRARSRKMKIMKRELKKKISEWVGAHEPEGQKREWRRKVGGRREGGRSRRVDSARSRERMKGKIDRAMSTKPGSPERRTKSMPIEWERMETIRDTVGNKPKRVAGRILVRRVLWYGSRAR